MCTRLCFGANDKQWIPHKKGQLCGACIYGMTSSWVVTPRNVTDRCWTLKHFPLVCTIGDDIRCHYSDVIISAMVSQITCVSIVSSTVCSGADQIKHQSSASLAFVKGIHWWPVDSPHKGPVTQKMLPVHVMMKVATTSSSPQSTLFHFLSRGPSGGQVPCPLAATSGTN